MKFFAKRQAENDFFILPEDEPQPSAVPTRPRPDSLTADEILSHSSEQQPNDTEASKNSIIITAPSTGSGRLEAMRRRMLSGEGQPETNAANTVTEPETGDGLPEESPAPQAVPEIILPDTEPDRETESEMTQRILIVNGVPDTKQSEEPIAPLPPPVEKDELPTVKTLLEKCSAYIVDENGESAAETEKPVYELESVEDILKKEDLLDLSAFAKAPAPAPTPTPAKPAEPLSEPKREVYEEALPNRTEDAPAGLPDISDIDNEVVPREQPDTAASSDTETIRFTPIRDRNTESGRMSVSTGTRPIDLTDELGPLSLPETEADGETNLTESEFEDFTPAEDADSPDEARWLIHKLSVKKRNAFLRVLGCLPLALASAALLLPVFSDFLMQSCKNAMIYCTVLLGVATLLNLDMFASLRYCISARATADLNASLAAISALLLGGAAISKSSNQYELLLLCTVILLLRAIGKFLRISALLGNLRQAAAPRAKKAVSLLSDEATTFAMARNAIDGDALIAAPRRTERITGFMKYSNYLPFMNGRIRIVAIGSLVLAAIAGPVAASYFGRMIDGFYTAAAILCLAALPSLFLIDSLPLHSAAARMNRKGCMIAGKAAAARLEMANAVVMSSHDIFPDGTVTLHNMKVLSENNFDETILRAAALTEAVDSPLTPIFKKIAGTNAAYTIPDADSVKYEDRLGLSGWVDDELLFIGNRTLMEAHGIQVPDVELDRSILRRGYFPVYIATGGKACALVVVQYNVRSEVVYELRRLTGMGVTVLVNSCDPNMTEEMICDYLGLYSDAVHVMSNAGVHMYKNAVPTTESCAAPAAFRGSPLNLASIINCASRIKRSNFALTAVYVLAMCIGVVLFTYLSFAGAGEPPHARTVLLYELGAAAAAWLFYLIYKP